MGSQGLAYAVHCFFLAALDLLGKRLLAMPIDDVDTTLHKAFDYLEVVRRYLSSVVVVPIVCGDLKLYREVTQRDAFRRLTKEMPNETPPHLRRPPIWQSNTFERSCRFSDASRYRRYRRSWATVESCCGAPTQITEQLHELRCGNSQFGSTRYSPAQ